MFDKINAIEERYNEVLRLLSDPGIANDQNQFRKLMKEQSDLAPIVESYQKYKQAKQTIDDSLEILETESDEDLKELAKEELATARKDLETIEETLKIQLLRKDENDDKNVVMEIRAGAGGDEAALFAADLYRM